MRPNEKRLTFANTRYLKLCTVQFLSFQIALSPCKDLLISTCANTINNVKLSRSVLGSGHGASLREDVAAAAIRPTLQGKETSLKMWK